MFPDPMKLHSEHRGSINCYEQGELTICESCGRLLDVVLLNTWFKSQDPQSDSQPSLTSSGTGHTHGAQACTQGKPSDTQRQQLKSLYFKLGFPVSPCCLGNLPLLIGSVQPARQKLLTTLIRENPLFCSEPMATTQSRGCPRC